MAIYEDEAIKEIPIYGSSRLGQYRPKTDAKKTALGQRIYEFSNHLGNVLVTLTDNKVPQTDGTYESVVVSASDYYPFGMAMKERTYQNSEYRFGFNGQEQSDELDENGNSYTAEFWQYDSKVARRWNLDPLEQFDSYYVSLGNNPVNGSDPDGAWFFGWFGSTTEQRDGARALAKESGGRVTKGWSKNIGVRLEWSEGTGSYDARKTSTLKDGTVVNGSEVGVQYFTRTIHFQENGRVDFGNDEDNKMADSHIDYAIEMDRLIAMGIWDKDGNPTYSGRTDPVYPEEYIAGGIGLARLSFKLITKGLIMAGKRQLPKYAMGAARSGFSKRKGRWGPRILYRGGGHGDNYQTAIEHISEKHLHNSLGNWSKFSRYNSRTSRIKKLTNEAIKKGTHSTAPNHSVMHKFRKNIGLDTKGNKTKWLKVYLDNDGNVINSYPVTGGTVIR